ncbi:MAG: ROK family protein [Chloroflexota bacterium]
MPATYPQLLVGVDIGGSKIAVLVVDDDLTIVGRRRVPTPVGEAGSAPERIEAAIVAALPPGTSLEDVRAVGVGVPGQVELDGGRIALAANLGWHEFALGELLSHRLGIPVVVENDVRAAAAGIHQRRLIGPVDDLIYLGVGTGIAAGVVLDGRLRRGTRGLAGEIGHAVVDPGGDLCECGMRGCLETVAAGRAIARRAGRTDAGEVFKAAAAGDPLAQTVVEDAGRHLASAIHLLALAYGVDAVVIGGGVARAGAPFLEPIVRELDRFRAASELNAAILPDGFVQLVPAGDETGAWGAVLSARRVPVPAEARRSKQEVRDRVVSPEPSA